MTSPFGNESLTPRQAAWLRSTLDGNPYSFTQGVRGALAARPGRRWHHH